MKLRNYTSGGVQRDREKMVREVEEIEERMRKWENKELECYLQLDTSVIQRNQNPQNLLPLLHPHKW